MTEKGKEKGKEKEKAPKDNPTLDDLKNPLIFDQLYAQDGPGTIGR